MSASFSLSAVLTTVECVWHLTHSSVTSWMEWDPPSLLDDRPWPQRPWVRKNFNSAALVMLLKAHEPIGSSSRVSLCFYINSRCWMHFFEINVIYPSSLLKCTCVFTHPGDVEIGLMERNGGLEVEVVQARGLTIKPGSKGPPGQSLPLQSVI